MTVDIAIKQERQQFLADVVSDGRYPSAEAAVDESLRRFEEHERKLQALRETIDASLARGGSNTDEEVAAHVAAALKAHRARKAAA